MRALSSRAWFWIAQVGGWGAYASSLFLTFLPSMEPGRRVAVLINKELRAVVGIAPANWNIYLPTNTHEPIAYMSTTGMADGTCKWINNDARKEGAKWAAIGHAMDNGCMAPTDFPVWTSGNHVCYDFQGCPAGYPVKACTFNGGHTDNSTEGGMNWIPTESWKFFSQF